MSDTCNATLIQAHAGYADACSFVQANCGDLTDYIPFFNLYYCGINQNVPLIIVISIAFIAFVFNLLGTTADAYLGPTIEIIAKKLKLSEAIAGVTLLALANGASDVIAGIVAGGKADGGITIAIGGLFGACFFTTSVVLARCIQGAGNSGVKVDKSGMQRDVVFLLIGAVYFCGVAIYGTMTVPLAAGFFVIYVTFIGLVIYQEHRRVQVQKSVQDKLSNIKKKLLSKHKDNASESALDKMITSFLMRSVMKRKLMKGKSISIKDFEIVDLTVNHEEGGEPEEEEDNSLFGRIVRAYNVPLLFIRDLTMPPYEADNWAFWKAVLTPIFGVPFICWQIGILDPTNIQADFWIIYACLAGLFEALILIGAKGGKHNLAETHSGILATFTFIISALWINLIANMFMDFLSLVTVISGLPLNFLSLTLLAWGNSLDDFFVDYIIAKNGHGRMAVTGVYGGQIFNLYMGFGGAMLRYTATYGSYYLGILDFSGPDADANILTVVLLITLIVSLILTVFVAKSNDWKLGQNMFKFLIGYYSIFLVAVTIISLTF